jgi:hypothetical protein
MSLFEPVQRHAKMLKTRVWQRMTFARDRNSCEGVQTFDISLYENGKELRHLCVTATVERRFTAHGSPKMPKEAQGSPK